MSRPGEIGENWNQGGDEKHDGASARNALLDDSGMTRIERVADKKTGSAPADAAMTAGVTPAEKQFNDALKAYDAASDKGAALLQLGPKFDGAIKTADEDFKKTLTASSAEGKKLMPAWEAATAKVESQTGKLQGVFAKVPQPERDKVATMLEVYNKLGKNDDGVAKAIEANLARYPGLTAAAKELRAAEEAAPLKRMTELEATVKRALGDRIQTRAGYADVLTREGGSSQKAEDLLRDAAKIMGIPVPEKQKPAGMYEALYRPA